MLNKRAITTVEVIVASIIAAVIVVAMSAVIIMSTKTYKKLREELAINEKMIVATTHLSRHIKGSSYTSVDTGLNTLELYDRSANLLGRYSLLGQTLQFMDSSNTTHDVTDNIALSFAEVAGTDTEVKVNFTQPFVNSIYVACRLSPPDTYSWADVIAVNDFAYANSVQQTADGGYIIAGHTYFFGPVIGDFCLIKTDSDGVHEWSKTFGGTDYDYADSVQQTSDGGYIIAGRTLSFGAGDCDIYLIKTDSDGDHEWSKAFGGTGDDYAHSVQQTSDGGYIIAGYTFSFGAGDCDIYLIKTDSDGDHEWSKTFGSTDYDYANSVQQTSDGGYIIAGHTYSFGAASGDAYLIKTDNNGDHEWSRTFGGTDYEFARSVQQASDGGYIMAGYTDSFGAGGSYAYLIKTDSDGDHEWSKTFGGSGADWANSVQQTSDGGYIIAGRTLSFGAVNGDAYLIKTDSDGGHEWSKAFGGSDYDFANSVQQTSDGGYIMAGYTDSFGGGDIGVYLIKTDSDGSCSEADTPTLMSDGPDMIDTTPLTTYERGLPRFPGIWVASRATPLGTSLIKIDSEGKKIAPIIEIAGTNLGSALNPTDGSLWLSNSTGIVKFDYSGNQLATAPCINYPWRISIDTSNDSFWVTDIYDALLKYDSGGNELFRNTDYVDSDRVVYYPSVDPNDGSCWVSYTDNVTPGDSQIVKFNPDGSEAFAPVTGYFSYPTGIAVNPDDSSCWVVDTGLGKIIRISPDGGTVQSYGAIIPSGPTSQGEISIDPAVNAVWITTLLDTQLRKVNSDTAALIGSRSLGISTAYVTADTIDNTCLCVLGSSEELIKVRINDDGTSSEIFRLDEMTLGGTPTSVGVDPNGDDCVDTTSLTVHDNGVPVHDPGEPS